MPVNLSVKNAPDHVVEKLRRRAERHHRSLQGELMAIIEAATREDAVMTPAEVLAEVRKLGIRTPDESAAIVRADRGAALHRVTSRRDRSAVARCIVIRAAPLRIRISERLPYEMSAASRPERRARSGVRSSSRPWC
jgi:plasmid stability protein